MPAPINLSEAALDLAQGDYGDLDAAEYLLEYAVVMQPPYLVAGVGLAIGVLCGLTFAKLVENKLEGWKQIGWPCCPWVATPSPCPTSEW